MFPTDSNRQALTWPGALLLACLACWGCGTTKQYEATQQLMASDAVDTAIARIDFTALAGQKVYFDTEYIKNYKGIGFTNAEYVISSLRQQMFAAGLLMQSTKEKADYILEGRIGALGEDDHEVVYGMPATNTLSAAASAVAATSGVPAVPSLPEISIARRKDQVAAAKVAVFAYERETGERVWQSGLKVARATSKNTWLFGVGPFQRGTIYDDKLRFAGAEIDVKVDNARKGKNGPIYAFKDQAHFKNLNPPKIPNLPELPAVPEVIPASAEVPASDPANSAAPK